MNRKIIIEPDPILRKKSEPLEKVDDDTRKLMDEMLQKLTYDLVLSSSTVPPIFRKIHRALDTKIFDYKKVKKYIYFTKSKKIHNSKNDSHEGYTGCLDV